MISKELDLYLKGTPRSAMLLCNEVESGIKSAFDIASIILQDSVSETSHHPDLKYFNNDTVKREVIDEVIDFSREMPVLAKRSVVIIRDAHNIAISTQDILLKTLEENTTCIILFVCSSPLIPTILSRVAVIRLRDSGKNYDVTNVKELYLKKNYKELFSIFGLLKEKDSKAISDKNYYIAIINAIRTCVFDLLLLNTGELAIDYCDNIVPRSCDECFDILDKCEQQLEIPFTENNFFGFLVSCCR